MSKERLTEKLQLYAKVYKESPYGREVEGTVELLETVAEELEKYHSLEEQGLLTRLPVTLGQTLYTNQRKSGWYFKVKDAPYRVEVVFIALNTADDMGGGYFNVTYEKHDHMMGFNFNDIGRTIFLTQSEAEEKLRELEGK